jgi:hypothetical protein
MVARPISLTILRFAKEIKGHPLRSRRATRPVHRPDAAPPNMVEKEGVCEWNLGRHTWAGLDYRR